MISRRTADDDRQLLKRGAHQFGVALSEEQVRLFLIFLQGVWSWNRSINLTGITGKREMLIQLLLDPLAALPYLPSKGTLLDVGSGAGIPGLPLKIARPEYEIHLLEAKAKKVSFLKDMIRQVGLAGITAYQGRAGKGDDQPALLNGYDIVTARALAPLKKTIHLCCPHISPGGLLLTFKGAGIDRELASSQGVMEALGFSIETKAAYRLPETPGERHLLVLKKEPKREEDCQS
ncbi:MAG: 16S rRNA (guanine(527)-N(7))-methyltransferase RsmG [Deltaproteobacteria bacterium]|nr:16S rRNA (guanine(527)-N(7))-methyltransferase RsmG [Deltaproteobacteria bacterium]MBW2077497.1 16S rRNA (guanine(527)-N(7))-methyltransferase RsmG [Deltaproteobacteria bacterium]RLB26176.1 MAG: 16S rRNA (guanine(527)-N(7))-methyltransferase RsmG [Deltaproteobacteria bacterium]